MSWNEEEDYLKSDKVKLVDVNLLTKDLSQIKTVKFRYRSEDIAVTNVYYQDDQLFIEYNQTKAVTPGQACVLYNDKECLGGGEIDLVYLNNQEKQLQ